MSYWEGGDNYQWLMMVYYVLGSFETYRYLQVAEAHFGDNDKMKLLTLYCGDEDPAVQRASCGALAILSSDYPEKTTNKIIAVSPHNPNISENLHVYLVWHTHTRTHTYISPSS